MTHPIWRQELKTKLIPAEQGLFRLKDEYVLPEAARYPGKAPRFVLSGEISSIYKKAENQEGAQPDPASGIR